MPRHHRGDHRGITSSLAHPQILVLGRYDTLGHLRAIGRTVPLLPEAARQVGEHLITAGAALPGSGCGSPRPGAAVTSQA
ncbi:hypothetical protein [Streptomyces sp. NPDC002990]